MNTSGVVGCEAVCVSGRDTGVVVSASGIAEGLADGIGAEDTSDTVAGPADDGSV